MKELSTLDLEARTGKGKGKVTGIIVILLCWYRTWAQLLSKSSKLSRVTMPMIKMLKHRKSSCHLRMLKKCCLKTRLKTSLRLQKSMKVVLKKKIQEVNELVHSKVPFNSRLKAKLVRLAWAAALLQRILIASLRHPSSCRRRWRWRHLSSRVQNCKKN